MAAPGRMTGKVGEAEAVGKAPAGLARHPADLGAAQGGCLLRQHSQSPRDQTPLGQSPAQHCQHVWPPGCSCHTRHLLSQVPMCLLSPFLLPACPPDTPPGHSPAPPGQDRNQQGPSDLIASVGPAGHGTPSPPPDPSTSVHGSAPPMLCTGARLSDTSASSGSLTLSTEASTWTTPTPSLGLHAPGCLLPGSWVPDPPWKAPLCCTTSAPLVSIALMPPAAGLSSTWTCAHVWSVFLQQTGRP